MNTVIQKVCWIITLALVPISGIIWTYNQSKPTILAKTLVASVSSVSDNLNETENTSLSSTTSKTIVTEPFTSAFIKQDRLNTYIQTLSGTYGIYIKNHLTNETFEYNSETQFVTASLYKLLELYPLILKLQTGEISWDTKIENTTVRNCTDSMLRYSDNECGIAISDLVGLEFTNQVLKSIGMNSTDLNNVDQNGELSGDKVTTAQDVGRYLEEFFYGPNIDNNTRAFILDLLSNQIYRDGIGAGIQSSKVYDKVGFLDDYINDAGLVIGDTQEFSLVILTQNSSWENIAEISTFVEKLLGE